MHKLKTVENKTIDLDTAYIAVHRNSSFTDTYFFSIKLVGKLPKCRKSEVLRWSFVPKGISITTLFGYRSHHQVSDNEFVTFIKTIPVISDRPYDNVVITPELEKRARIYIENLFK